MQVEEEKKEKEPDLEKFLIPETATEAVVK